MINWEELIQSPISKPVKSDNDFVNIKDIENINNIQTKFDTTCKYCKINMEYFISKYICKKCGLEVEYEDYSSNIYDINVNGVSENTFVPFKYSGKNSNIMNKNLIKDASDYVIYSQNNTVREIREKTYNHKKIKDNVVVAACCLYETIKSVSNVYRGSSRKGLLAYCIYIKSDEYNIPLKPTYICQVLEVQYNYFLKAHRIIYNLLEKKKIILPNIDNKKKMENRINLYLNELQIDICYSNFIIDIINTAERKFFHLRYDCEDSTKYGGTILILASRVKKYRYIDPIDIAATCGMSKPTIKKYYKMIMDNHDKFKNKFKKHSIPMPKEWRKQQ